jgi:hypothetical protein
MKINIMANYPAPRSSNGRVNLRAMTPEDRLAYKREYSKRYNAAYVEPKHTREIMAEQREKDTRSRAHQLGNTHLKEDGFLSAKGAKEATEMSSAEILTGRRVLDTMVRQSEAMLDGLTQRGGFLSIGHGCYWKSNGRTRF